MVFYRRHAGRFGHIGWAQFWAHSARFSIDLFRKRKKTSQGDGFLDRRLGCPVEMK
jgi:hypothetical protein